MQTNQVLDLLTHVKAISCQFLMKYMPPFILIQLSRLGDTFLDILKAFDRVWNEGLIKSVSILNQYNTALGIIRGTSQVKLYVELVLDSLKARRWFRRLCYLYKFKSYGLPTFLFQLIPEEFHSYNTHNSKDIPIYHFRTDSSKNYFFPWTIREWNKLDLGICKST